MTNEQNTNDKEKSDDMEERTLLIFMSIVATVVVCGILSIFVMSDTTNVYDMEYAQQKCTEYQGVRKMNYYLFSYIISCEDGTQIFYGTREQEIVRQEYYDSKK